MLTIRTLSCAANSRITGPFASRTAAQIKTP